MLNKMIKVITATGADDSVEDINEMISISEMYPGVEWGILLSKNNVGTPRFPSLSWINNLSEHNSKNPGILNLSAHLCGRWMREIFLEGKAEVFDIIPMEIFKRVQFNFHGQQHRVDQDKMISILKEKFSKYELIFQADGVNNNLMHLCRNSGISANPLFDKSGGAGVLPDEWPIATSYSGYAGGLSPENVTYELSKIYKVSSGNQIWLDAETYLRSSNDTIFDLNKVKSYLNNVYSWIF